MGQNKEQLQKLLAFIDSLTKEKGNEWFVEELEKKITNIKESYSDQKTQTNIIEIRDILRIKASQSVNYSFIDDKYIRLKNQLIIDNIRMENALLDVQISSEIERFYNFCINVFYQVENLLNYFYYVSFSEFDDLLNYLENVPNTQFKRTKEKNIDEINIYTKIFSFSTTFLPHPDYKNKKYNQHNFNLNSLREVRNEGLHRCMVIQKDKTENEKIFNFFKYQTFESIRSTLIVLVDIIKTEKNIKKIKILF